MTTVSAISGHVSCQNQSLLLNPSFGFPNLNTSETSSDASIFGPMAFTSASVPEAGTFALCVCGVVFLSAARQAIGILDYRHPLLPQASTK
jgi:hypothetical protein